MPDVKDIHAARDVVMGDQYNQAAADLSRLEARLDQIIALLRQSATRIEMDGQVRDSIVIAGDDNTVITLSKSDLALFGKLQSGAAPARREEIYLTHFILGETYAPWERRYLPLAGYLHTNPTLNPSMRLRDRADQGLSQAGIKVDDIRQAITQHKKTRLVILGEPGCGKTTTLNRLALELAHERLRHPLNARLPMRLDLFSFDGDNQQPDEFLKKEWELTGLAGSYGEALSGDQLCFLLDGVNQMSSLHRSRDINRWAHWANEKLPDQHWAIFTCRTADYVLNLGLPEVQVNLLIDEQIRKYFELRFEALAAEQHWAEFEKRLLAGNDRFERLARNPFMLNLMADSLAEGKSFGDSRALLMQDLADRLIDRELKCGRQPEALIADPKSTLDAMSEALSRLAFAVQKRDKGTGLPRDLAEKTPLHARGGVTLPLGDVLKLALDATLLEEAELAEKGKTQPGYAFYHHLLLEYFAAKRLLALFRAGENVASYARVSWRKWQFVFQPLVKGQQLPPPPVTGWEETLTFAAALAGRDAEKLVAQIAKVNLPLAGRCLVEAGAQRKDLQPLVERTRAALLRRQRAESAHLRARIDAGLALGELGHPGLRQQPFEFEGQPVWAILPPMQAIPAGEFLLGSDPADKNDYDYEKTSQRRQTLPAYCIGRYAITNAEFKHFIDAGGYQVERWWSAEGLQWKAGGPNAHASAMENWLDNREWFKKQNIDQLAQSRSWASSTLNFWKEVTILDDAAARERAHQIFERPFNRPGYWDDTVLASPARPVVGVNWHEASAYCAWLSAVSGQNFRLPAEMEWEKAARGLDGRAYPWGEKFDPAKCNSVESQIYTTTPVGLYPNGVSPMGVWETSGNIWEWCADWYGAFPGQPVDLIAQYGEKFRVVRGGSFLDLRWYARCAYRSRYGPAGFDPDLGFRVVSPGIFLHPDC
jgi:formylglycine-generating enzyme required for sulfatase activity